MELELRPVTDEELPRYSAAVSAAFGQHLAPGEVERWARLTAGSDRMALFDEGEVVGTAGAFPFELTVPGGATVPASGLTAVGVRPTHRRRGLLNRLMADHLDRVGGRGQPVSILTASEASIYGRYGYGPAAALAWWHLPTRGTAFASPSRATGRLRIVDRDRAREVAPAVYDAHRAVTAGALTRSAAFWDDLFLDPESDRDGASAHFFVVHEDADGVPDGYATYRMKEPWDDHGLPAGELIATSVVAADPEVDAAIWELLASVDLVTTVRGVARPVDDPLRWRLADPRRLCTDRVIDHLWVRVLDVVACLGARSYGTADAVVLEVVDGRRPEVGGTWRLEAGPDGASCARARAGDAQVTLGVAELGALWLGGVRASTLARAGRLEAATTGALAALDRLLATPDAPWCATEF